MKEVWGNFDRQEIERERERCWMDETYLQATCISWCTERISLKGSETRPSKDRESAWLLQSFFTQFLQDLRVGFCDCCGHKHLIFAVAFFPKNLHVEKNTSWWNDRHEILSFMWWQNCEILEVLLAGKQPELFSQCGLHVFYTSRWSEILIWTSVKITDLRPVCGFFVFFSGGYITTTKSRFELQPSNQEIKNRLRLRRKYVEPNEQEKGRRGRGINERERARERKGGNLKEKDNTAHSSLCVLDFRGEHSGVLNRHILIRCAVFMERVKMLCDSFRQETHSRLVCVCALRGDS